MTKSVAGLACLIFVASVAGIVSDTGAAADRTRNSEGGLIALASAKFPNLTRAERALLAYADKSNLSRGMFALAGSSPDPLDPSNDPANAKMWSRDRDVRSTLIRWIAVDDAATTEVDANGVRLLGARIVGPIDLAQLKVPFALILVRCWIPQPIDLEAAELPSLDFSGSYTSRINARRVFIRGNLYLGSVTGPFSPLGGDLLAPFSASGTVDLTVSKILGAANFAGGHFRYEEETSLPVERILRIALFISDAEIGGDIALCCGFQSDGCAFVAKNTIGGDIDAFGGRFVNPNNVALEAGGNDVKGTIFIGENPGFETEGSESDGLVMLENSRVAAVLIDNARFRGQASERHGLFASGLSVRGPLVWHDVKLENGAIVELSAASVGSLFDEERSWPAPGTLLIDGFIYGNLGGKNSFFPWTSPRDADSRLRWLALQDGYHPQPFRQLAKVLRESGDEAGAVKVMIASGDARYSQYGFIGRVWGDLLKFTIGYGHRPLLAILWSAVVVIFGALVVASAKRARVMRLTWPENNPIPPGDPVARLHPFLYSLDTFLPFVNLHQGHYWWPDSETSGRWAWLGTSVEIRGSFVEYYLWAQIIAGWLLSAIFVAGVTGLIRND